MKKRLSANRITLDLRADSEARRKNLVERPRGGSLDQINLRVAITLILACWPLLAFAVSPKNPGLIGVLQHKAPVTTSDVTSFEPAIAVLAEPSIESQRIGELRNISSAEAYEWNYEQLGLSVSGYFHDGTAAWYRVHVTKLARFGWIRERPDLIFHGLSRLITESLSHMTGAWNRVLYADPNSPETASEIGVSGDEIPIEVAGTAIVGGKLWVHVVVLGRSQCESAEAPPVLGVGWVPATTEDGRLNIWFYSRGC